MSRRLRVCVFERRLCVEGASCSRRELALGYRGIVEMKLRA